MFGAMRVSFPGAAFDPLQVQTSLWFGDVSSGGLVQEQATLDIGVLQEETSSPSVLSRARIAGRATEAASRSACMGLALPSCSSSPSPHTNKPDSGQE